MIKINVWQVGYTSREDFHKDEREKAVCKEMGYVELEELKEWWEEDVWEFLNWSCWNYDENHVPIKPDNVHSPLTHCNADIIIQIDGNEDYLYSKDFGFGKAKTLDEAIEMCKKEAYTIWPFREEK